MVCDRFLFLFLYRVMILQPQEEGEEEGGSGQEGESCPLLVLLRLIPAVVLRLLHPFLPNQGENTTSLLDNTTYSEHMYTTQVGELKTLCNFQALFLQHTSCNVCVVLIPGNTPLNSSMLEQGEEPRACLLTTTDKNWWPPAPLHSLRYGCVQL